MHGPNVKALGRQPLHNGLRIGVGLHRKPDPARQRPAQLLRHIAEVGHEQRIVLPIHRGEHGNRTHDAETHAPPLGDVQLQRDRIPHRQARLGQKARIHQHTIAAHRQRVHQRAQRLRPKIRAEERHAGQIQPLHPYQGPLAWRRARPHRYRAAIEPRRVVHAGDLQRLCHGHQRARHRHRAAGLCLRRLAAQAARRLAATLGAEHHPPLGDAHIGAHLEIGPLSQVAVQRPRHRGREQR